MLALQFEIDEHQSRFYEQPEFLDAALRQERLGWVLIKGKHLGAPKDPLDLFKGSTARTHDTSIEIFFEGWPVQPSEAEERSNASHRTPTLVQVRKDHFRTIERRWPCSVVATFFVGNSVEDMTDSFPWQFLTIREPFTVPARYVDFGVIRALVTPAVFAVDLTFTLFTMGAIGYGYGADYLRLKKDLGYLPFPFTVGPETALQAVRDG